jgi:prepilin-type N-terminal cleavage/methylation domain-containing protein
MGRARGFTLVELSMVLSVMAILVALSVPAYDGIVRRARAAEARATLEAIGDAELAHYRDTGTFLSCGSPKEGALFDFDPNASCWRQLGIHFEGRPRFRYGVAVEPSGFVALAAMEVDRRGKVWTFKLVSQGLTLTELEPR